MSLISRQHGQLAVTYRPEARANRAAVAAYSIAVACALATIGTAIAAARCGISRNWAIALGSATAVSLATGCCIQWRQNRPLARRPDPATGEAAVPSARAGQAALDDDAPPRNFTPILAARAQLAHRFGLEEGHILIRSNTGRLAWDLGFARNALARGDRVWARASEADNFEPVTQVNLDGRGVTIPATEGRVSRVILPLDVAILGRSAPVAEARPSTARMDAPAPPHTVGPTSLEEVARASSCQATDFDEAMLEPRIQAHLEEVEAALREGRAAWAREVDPGAVYQRIRSVVEGGAVVTATGRRLFVAQMLIQRPASNVTIPVISPTTAAVGPSAPVADGVLASAASSAPIVAAPAPAPSAGAAVGIAAGPSAAGAPASTPLEQVAKLAKCQPSELNIEWFEPASHDRIRAAIARPTGGAWARINLDTPFRQIVALRKEHGADMVQDHGGNLFPPTMVIVRK